MEIVMPEWMPMLLLTLTLATVLKSSALLKKGSLVPAFSWGLVAIYYSWEGLTGDRFALVIGLLFLVMTIRDWTTAWRVRDARRAKATES